VTITIQSIPKLTGLAVVSVIGLQHQGMRNTGAILYLVIDAMSAYALLVSSPSIPLPMLKN